MTSDDPAYKVGYGKPPREHRFKPGTSGNPRGRPKRDEVRIPTSRALAVREQPLNLLMLAEAHRVLTFNLNGKKTRSPLWRRFAGALLPKQPAETDRAPDWFWTG